MEATAAAVRACLHMRTLQELSGHDGAHESATIKLSFHAESEKLTNCRNL